MSVPAAPWHVDSLRLSNKEWADVRPGSEQTIVTSREGTVSDVICCVFAPDRRDVPDRARLIAAAPDLLEALEKTPLRGLAEDAHDFDERQNAWLRDFYNPAIAKARGAA